MNIKEAFESLAKVTFKGLKNPFFVIRGLYQTFNEIADEIEEEIPDADKIPFDKTGTTLSSDTVQGAIEELASLKGEISNSSITFALPPKSVALVITSHPYYTDSCGMWIVCGGYVTTAPAVFSIVAAKDISVIKTDNQIVEISTESACFYTVLGLK